MYPGQTAPDRLLRTDSDSATDAPMGPQNEVKGTLEGESRTKCTQDRRLRTRRHSPLTPHRSAPLNPVRTGPPKRGEKIFGGRVQNKCTQDRRLRTRRHGHGLRSLEQLNPLNPVRAGQGPQNEEKRTLEGESRTKCTQDRPLRADQDPTPQPLKPSSLLPPLSAKPALPDRSERNFGGRVQNKCTQDRPLRTDPDLTPQSAEAQIPPEPLTPSVPDGKELWRGSPEQMYPGQTAPDPTPLQPLQPG